MTDTLESVVKVVTLDGPSGVGKGTMAQILAKDLGYHLLDSGAIYRLAALASIQQNMSPEDEDKLVEMCTKLDITFDASDESKVQVILGGENVTSRIRNEDIAQRASQIAAIGPVRAALLQRQRDFAQEPGLVADGRDMGTVVFPEAPVKFYLTAAAQVRARRRFDELQANGLDVEFNSILHEIQERDTRDSQRKVAPLKPADDAIVIDTSDLSIDAVKQEILSHLNKSLLA